VSALIDDRDDRDYVSPGLAVVHPDAAFPRMRPADRAANAWPYLRREIPHRWYTDERYPLMGFLNRDEATILHNIALQFRGKRALEIGSWLGWSTCHLALAGVELDVIDPAHDDADVRAIVEDSLDKCGIADRVHLAGGQSPAKIDELAKQWSLFFIDGDHEGLAPLLDTLACRPYATHDCAFVFHDLAAPSVANAIRFLRDDGFHVLLYQTAQIMGIAWRGNVTPVEHVPDPHVRWVVPEHLRDLPIAGEWAGGQVGEWASKRFADSPTRPLADSPTPPRVCIVTNELIGPFKNGGIGTAMTGLAETLASGGMSVTVLYTGHAGTALLGFETWREHYNAKNIELVALTIEDTEWIQGPLRHASLGVPWLVYTWLAEHHFDLVHFNECRGEGSLALAAKRLSLGFEETLFVVAMHSPSQWVLELNHTSPASTVLAAFSYCERLSSKCADVIWSPSEYMLGWARDHDFVLPENTFVQRYAIPAVPESHPPSDIRHPIHELVFFGRLEERKGLRLFCNALDALNDDLAQRNVTVTFLGKPHTCGGMNSLDYLAKRSAAWTFRMQTITDHGQPEAIEYLRGGNRLAVMASPLDNSPCTVYEALAHGLPFVAARTGGIPELVHADDRDKVLFDYTTDALRAALVDALDHGGSIARAATTQEEARRAWIAMHENWRALLPGVARYSHVGPRSIVAIVDAGLPQSKDLDATLASLDRCADVRRVVVLDRTNPESLREVLASLADDAVLFVHAGVIVEPEPVARMLVCLRAEGVEGFLPAARIGAHDEGRVVPHIGGSAPFALFEGPTFTGGLFVRADVLLRATSHRTLAPESPFMGLADFCVVRGEIWPFPEVAFEIPEHWKATGSEHPARVAAYSECSPSDRLYITAMAYGGAPQGGPVRFGRRQIAYALIDHGFAPLVRAGVWGLRAARRVARLVGKR